MPHITGACRDDVLRAAAELETEAKYREGLQPHLANRLGAAKLYARAAVLRAAAKAARS